MSELPTGWRWAKLGDVCAPVRGVTFASADASLFMEPGQVACVTTSGVQNTVAWESRRFIPKVSVSDEQMLRETDILMSTANSKALVGKNCIVGKIPYSCTFGAFVTVLRPYDINPLFLSYALRTREAYRFYYERSSETVNISNLRVSELMAFKIPLPPLAGQERIARALSAQLSEVEQARAAIEAQLQSAKALPAAILAQVFGNGNPEGEPDAFSLKGVRWEWKRLGDICGINPRRPALERAMNEVTTFIPMTAVDDKGRGIARAESKLYSEVRNGYTFFQQGDVIFAKITPCMQNGKHAIASYLLDGIGFGSTEFHVLRPDNTEVIAEWIHYFLIQPSLLNTAVAAMTGAVGQQRIPAEYIADLKTPVPPLETQKQIARDLRERLDAARDLLEALQRERDTVNALPAALLSRAFGTAAP